MNVNFVKSLLIIGLVCGFIQNVEGSTGESDDCFEEALSNSMVDRSWVQDIQSESSLLIETRDERLVREELLTQTILSQNSSAEEVESACREMIKSRDLGLSVQTLDSLKEFNEVTAKLFEHIVSNENIDEQLRAAAVLRIFGFMRTAIHFYQRHCEKKSEGNKVAARRLADYSDTVYPAFEVAVAALLEFLPTVNIPFLQKLNLLSSFPDRECDVLGIDEREQKIQLKIFDLYRQVFASEADQRWQSLISVFEHIDEQCTLRNAAEGPVYELAAQIRSIAVDSGEQEYPLVFALLELLSRFHTPMVDDVLIDLCSNSELPQDVLKYAIDRAFNYQRHKALLRLVNTYYQQYSNPQEVDAIADFEQVLSGVSFWRQMMRMMEMPECFHEIAETRILLAQCPQSSLSLRYANLQQLLSQEGHTDENYALALETMLTIANEKFLQDEKSMWNEGSPMLSDQQMLSGFDVMKDNSWIRSLAFSLSSGPRLPRLLSRALSLCRNSNYNSIAELPDYLPNICATLLPFAALKGQEDKEDLADLAIAVAKAFAMNETVPEDIRMKLARVVVPIWTIPNMDVEERVKLPLQYFQNLHVLLIMYQKALVANEVAVVRTVACNAGMERNTAAVVVATLLEEAGKNEDLADGSDVATAVGAVLESDDRETLTDFALSVARNKAVHYDFRMHCIHAVRPVLDIDNHPVGAQLPAQYFQDLGVPLKVDPLLMLTQEIIVGVDDSQSVAEYLTMVDLGRLAQVSRAWREFLSETELRRLQRIKTKCSLT